MWALNFGDWGPLMLAWNLGVGGGLTGSSAHGWNPGKFAFWVGLRFGGGFRGCQDSR